MKITIFDRVLLLITALFAAYQIAVGIDGFSTLPKIAYSISFGVLLIAGLLLIILGFEVLDSPFVVIVSTIIPLSLATGLIGQHLSNLQTLYLIFAFIGFLAVLITRTFPLKNKLPLFILILVHGVAGLTILILPLFLVFSGRANPGFSLISVGGALIGLGGMLLALLKAGKPLLSRQTIYRILPLLLLLMTASFLAGFTFA